MNNLMKWLTRHGIEYRPTAEWSLMFSGNFPDGVFIDYKHIDAIYRYNRRNKAFQIEPRGNYTTLYLFPTQSAHLINKEN